MEICRIIDQLYQNVPNTVAFDFEARLNLALPILKLQYSYT